MGRAGAVAVVVALLGLGGWLLLRGGGPDPAGALAVLDDDGRFTSSRRAAEAFVEAGSILRETGTRCIDRISADAPRCGQLLQASAFAHVAALRVSRCTLPDAHDARQAMLIYVRRLIRSPNGAAEPPPLPEC